MKRWMLILALLWPSLGFATGHNVTSLTVIASDSNGTTACATAGACNGWVLEVAIPSISTGGTYALGFSQATNNKPSSANVILTVTSDGYTRAGGATTYTRYVYATHQLRKPYNSAATNDEYNNAGTVILRLALSEVIYSTDTVTAQIAAGIYTDGSSNTNNAVSAGTSVTNNSTLTVPKPIANWSYPGWQRITGSAFSARAVAFHRHGMNNLPVACLVFTATDAHSHSVSVTVAKPTIDLGMNDPLHNVVEYVASLSTSTLTQGDLITVNFKVYPWIGGAASVLDTSDAVNAQPTPLYAPQYYLNDKSGTWGTAAAVVDPGAGNDSNNCAVAESGYVQGTTPPGGACLTINGAAVKMAAFNNTNYSHNDASGTMYLKAGNYAWTGASASVPNTTSKIWCTLTPFSGVAKSSVVINSQSGSQSFGSQCTSGSTNCGTPICLNGLTVNIATNPVSVFNGITYLWLKNVSVTMNGTAPFYQVTDVHLTDNTTTPSTMGGNGLYPFSTVNISFALLRGVDFTGLASKIYAYTVIGCINQSINGAYLSNELGGQTNPVSNQAIVAFNGLYRMEPVSNFPIGLNYTNTGILGEAIIQNVVENNYTNSTIVTIGLTADSSTGATVNNALLWHNTLVGGRMNRAYNETGSSALIRTLWSEVGEAREQEAIKADTFTGGSGANGVRVGNWAELYGVGRRGVYNAEITGGSTGFAATGSFQMEFGGLNSFNPTVTAGATQPPQSLTQTINTGTGFPMYFKNRAAYDGTNANAGMGNYRPLSNSPLIGLFPANSDVLPYDFAGIIRDNTGMCGTAGAYQAPHCTQVFVGFGF